MRVAECLSARSRRTVVTNKHQHGASQQKGDDHVEEADAHPNPGYDHEWARRADLEEFHRNRFGGFDGQ